MVLLSNEPQLILFGQNTKLHSFGKVVKVLPTKNIHGEVFKGFGESIRVKRNISDSYNSQTQESERTKLRKRYENKLPRLKFLAVNNPQGAEYKQLHHECALIFDEFNNLES